MSNNDAIGGYFSLELPLAKQDKYPGSLKFQSARAAFHALLLQMPHIQCVYAPNYICDSMLAPIRSAGKRLVLYEIDEKFMIKNKFHLTENDLLLYVNYFGVSGNQVKQILNSFDPVQVVIDCSQAFFSGPYDCLATIYSPRKFFGVPDGGLMVTNQVLKLPGEQDISSESRMNHLLQRLAFSAEHGYEEYKLAEESLSDFEPKRMSRLTTSLLESIDYYEIEKKRKHNFLYLHQALGGFNRLCLENIDDAPMCYPLLPLNKIAKSRLAKHRIYIPTYWPDVIDRNNVVDYGTVAAKDLVAISCDQRYSEVELNIVIEFAKKEIGNEY